jgi:hypothetical protein
VIQEFVKENPEAVLETTRNITSKRHSFSAWMYVSRYTASRRSKKKSPHFGKKYNFLSRRPWGRLKLQLKYKLTQRSCNTNLGRYMNFKDLLDMIAIAIPIGFFQKCSYNYRLSKFLSSAAGMRQFYRQDKTSTSRKPVSSVQWMSVSSLTSRRTRQRKTSQDNRKTRQDNHDNHKSKYNHNKTRTKELVPRHLVLVLVLQTKVLQTNESPPSTSRKIELLEKK